MVTDLGQIIIIIIITANDENNNIDMNSKNQAHIQVERFATGNMKSAESLHHFNKYNMTTST